MPRANQQIVPSLATHCRFSFSGSMMKRMSFSETIFLFFLALIIFGPKKLPEIARQIGKYMNEFKRASNEFKAQIEQEISHLEVENRQTILPPSPTPEGATSRKLYAGTVEPAASGHPAEAPIAAVPTTEAATTGTSTTQPSTTQTSTTQFAADDEPLFAAGAGAGSTAPSASAAEPASPSGEVTAPTSQESHV
jgi:sec-independent protein translocase protein TatB